MATDIARQEGHREVVRRTADEIAVGLFRFHALALNHVEFESWGTASRHWNTTDAHVVLVTVVGMLDQLQVISSAGDRVLGLFLGDAL